MKISLNEVAKIIHNGSEKSGLSFHALFSLPNGEIKNISFPYEIWGDNIESKDFLLHGEKWGVLIWDVVIDIWPKTETLNQIIEKTFNVLLKNGACVAWIGREGFFCDPPDLFLPDMNEGVLAAALPGKKWINLDIDSFFTPLSDSVVLELRKQSDGVSNVD